MDFTYKPSLANQGFTKNEISYFSQKSAMVMAVDKSTLERFALPTYAELQRWNVRDGYKNYTPKTYEIDESTIADLLKMIVFYESKHPGKKPQIVCHGGLFKDIIVQKDIIYDVVKYHGQYLIATTNRRIDQNEVTAYIGIRFEDLLKYHDIDQPTTTNLNCFKTIHTGSIGNRKKKHFKYICATEIDSVKGNDKIFPHYTEIKLTLARNVNWKLLCSSRTSKKRFLSELCRKKRFFCHQLLQYAIQCKFGMSNYLVIGIRNSSFMVQCVKQFSVDKDIIPFLKEYYPKQYNTYVHASDRLYQFFQWLIESMRNTEVGQIHISSTYQFYPKEGEEEKRIFDKVVIPEFREWRENKKNTLGDTVVAPNDVDTLQQSLEKVHI